MAKAELNQDVTINESDRTLFIKIFSNDGRFIWSGDYKKLYIHKLKILNDLTQRQLPENIIHENAEIILDKVLAFDKGLLQFKSFHRHFELYARKAIEIYKIPLSNTEKDELKKIDEVNYDLNEYSDWTQIGVEKTEDSISFILGKSSQQSNITKITKESLPEEVWDNVGNVAKANLNAYGSNLVSINAKVITPKRMIIKISFSLEDGFIDIGCDDFSVDETGKKIKDYQFTQEKNAAIKTLLSTLPIENDTKNKIEDSIVTGDGSIFTKETLKRIGTLKEPDIILIPTSQSFDREDDSIPESSERVISTLYKQKISEILPKIRTHYENNSSLEGFFQEHDEHNSTNAKITYELLEDEKAERTGYHAYILLVRNASEYEKPIATEGALEGKCIEHISVDFDYKETMMDIRNSNYSKEIYDVIISKIREFSEQ